MTTPKQFKISELLANAIQPFPDMNEEELTALAASLKDPKAAKYVEPVKLASAELGYRMFDGSQRARAWEMNKRVMIGEAEFKVYDEVKTEDDALFWATRFNAGRRHLSPEQRAQHALALRNTHRWSDARIADAMNVSKMTIGRWLKGEAKPDNVIGKDGVMQPPKATKQPQSQPFIKSGDQPWQGDGHVLRSVIRLTTILEDMTEDGGRGDLPLPSKDSLGEQQYDFCEMRLTDLIKAVNKVLAEMKKPRPAPAKPKTPPSKTTSRTSK